jgi:hypothetical protein
MAKVQLADSESRSATYYFEFVMGFCEFRRGEFEKAVEWMEKVLSHSEVPPEKATQANAVLAMARLQLMEPEDDRGPWKSAWEAAKDGLAGTNEHDLGKSWVAWVITNCILEEAQALLNRNSEEPPGAQNQRELERTIAP